MIPKIVIDTNIYISAIFWGGKPREIIDLGRNGNISIFTSSPIKEEIDHILKTKFKLSTKETSQILLDLSTFTSLIKSTYRITLVDDDPDDNKFIECALSAKADFIVSGDKHLLRLKQYNGIKIMKSSEFIAIMAD